MTDSSLHLYNDFVKKMYFSYSCLCGKISNPQQSCKNSTWMLIYSLAMFTRCCHFATFALPLHTHILFWGTIWGLIAVCHFNTSAYVSWEQVFFFNLSTITWLTNLTYNSIIKHIVHIQISQLFHDVLILSFIQMYVYIFYIYNFLLKYIFF